MGWKVSSEVEGGFQKVEKCPPYWREVLSGFGVFLRNGVKLCYVKKAILRIGLKIIQNKIQ